MDVPRRPRRNSSSMDEDGNVLWHGVKLGEFWKTDLQVAITDSNRREDASFAIRVGKAGTTHPYQQSIPMDFARCYVNLFQESITLEGPTGQTWTTVIRDFHQVVRFGKGWRQFSVENHLQEGYQLMFTLVGKFRFLVQFFDNLGKRCTSYPPLPVAQSGSLSVAETQRQPDVQPGFQPVVDGGQASHRHGSEGQTSTAIPLMGNTLNSGVPLTSDPDNVIQRQHGPGLPLPHEHVRELEEHTVDVSSPQIQDHNNSPPSGDELPFQYHPEMRKKQVTMKRPPPVAPPVASYHEAGSSSGSSPAMLVLQQQGCTRFSEIVLTCERRDVSDQERRVVVEAAKRFVSALGTEKFMVVMRDEQVYHSFHLAIPGKILEATGTERESKVEVCLIDREQALYKAHWTRQNFYELPLLDRDAWAKFAVDHTLEEGDVCVFQLLQIKPAVSMPAFLFCVHIFRVVETPVGQLGFSD